MTLKRFKHQLDRMFDKLEDACSEVYLDLNPLKKPKITTNSKAEYRTIETVVVTLERPSHYRMLF